MYLEFSENVDVNIDVLWNIVTDTFDDSACTKNTTTTPYLQEEL